MNSQRSFARALANSPLSLVLLTVGVLLMLGPANISGFGHASSVAQVPRLSQDALGVEEVQEAEAQTAPHSALSLPTSPLSGFHLGASLQSTLAAVRSLSIAPAVVTTYLEMENITDWVNSASGPNVQFFASAAYDPVSGYVVTYGGITANSNGKEMANDETWVFHDNTWTNLTATAGPSPPVEEDANMVWDATDSMIVLAPTVGVSGSAQPYFWGFADGKWTNLTTASAPSLIFSQATYDASRGAVIVASGIYVHPAERLSNDTWSFSGGVWTNITSSVGRIPVEIDGVLGYDPQGPCDILYGGSELDHEYTGYTWELIGGRWVNTSDQQFTSETPGDTTYGSLIWDPEVNEMLFLGGLVEGSVNLDINAFADGQWEGTVGWDGASYPDTALPTVAWDGGDNGLIIFSGLFRNILAPQNFYVLIGEPYVTDVEYSDYEEVGQWATFNTTVSVGGWGPITWSWSGLPAGCSSTAPSFRCEPTAPQPWTAWTLTMSDSIGDQTQAGGQVVVAPAVNIVVSASSNAEVGHDTWLSSTISGGYSPYWECTWLVNGAPLSGASTCTNATWMPAAPGTYGVSEQVEDWEDYTTTSTPISVDVAGPLMVGLTASATAVDVGVPLSLSINSEGGYALSTCEWWANGAVLTTNTCGTTSYTPKATGTDTFQVVAWDASGAEATSALVSVDVNPAPWIESFSVSPGAIDVGGEATFVVEAAGGTGPLAFSYIDLPSGCTGSTAQVNCAPKSASDSPTSVVVSDADGLKADANATLAVAAAPSVILSESSSSVSVGSDVVFSATESGGTGAITYTWSGLPAGCGPANGPSVGCAPSASGTYQVTVTVTDAVGQSNTASTSLSVASTAASSNPLAAGFLGMPGDEGALLLVLLIFGAIVVVLQLLSFLRKGKEERGSAPPRAPSPPSWSETNEPPAAPAVAGAAKGSGAPSIPPPPES